MAELDPSVSPASLIDDRRDARRRISIATSVLASVVPVLVLGALSHSVLVIATLYVPVAVFFGAKQIAKGMTAHAIASYKLHRLTAGSADLPQARLLADGSVPSSD